MPFEQKNKVQPESLDLRELIVEVTMSEGVCFFDQIHPVHKLCKIQANYPFSKLWFIRSEYGLLIVDYSP